VPAGRRHDFDDGVAITHHPSSVAGPLFGPYQNR